MRTLLMLLLTGALAALAWQAAGIGGAAPGYPLVVTAAGVLFAMVWLAAGLLTAPVEDPAGRGADLSGRAAWLFHARALAFLGVWAAYVATLETLGFIIGSWLALCLSLLVLGGRLRLRAVAGTAVFVAVLAVLLKSVLYVPVPQAWADVQLDVLLYRMR